MAWDIARAGVRLGMAVVDADGRRLGKVTRCDAWAFEVTRGLFSPYSWVVGWDELLGVEGGRVRVARSEDTLLELAQGRLPHAWSQTAPPEPSPAAGRELEGVRPGEGEPTPPPPVLRGRRPTARPGEPELRGRLP